MQINSENVSNENEYRYWKCMQINSDGVSNEWISIKVNANEFWWKFQMKMDFNIENYFEVFNDE